MQSTITVRLPDEMRERLESIARERRMASGDPVPLSELVREALERYVEAAK